jgi:phospholipid/cholesterol/gamma-HCH transport system substrate-binding protein
MADQAKNILIGLFVLAAFGIIAFMLLFLHPTVGDEGKEIRIRFSDIDKVNIGTRVTYGGKPVGEVVSIHEIEDPKHPRLAKNGFIYLYEVVVKVDSSVEIFNSDEVSLRTSGLLGEKSVAITPQAPKAGVPLINVEKEVIYANESGTVEEALKDLQALTGKFGDTLNVITDVVTSIRDQKLVDKVTTSAQNIADITSALNDKDKWNGILANADNFARDLAAGEGTVGRLVRDDTLYLRTNSLLSKAEVALDDVNHYGLFFSSDRNWQKVRARRANLLYRLEDPQEFRNYFNDEIDQIYTSLARVNTVLQESYDPCQCIGDSPEYRSVFAELLRRVKQMEESVRLYNQQLMNVDTECCP